MQLLRTLLTSTLCLTLGAAAGVAMKSSDTATLPAQEPIKAAPSPSTSLALAHPPPPDPPPFTSADAALSWVRAQMELGDTRAAERLFRKSAGLTADQRILLARTLTDNFRRLDPRVLARIILGLPRGQESDRLLWRLVTDWSANDAEEALRFIETLPADRLNTVGVLTNAAFGLSLLPAERVLAFAARLDDRGRSYLAEGLVGFADQGGSWRNTTAILTQLNPTPPPDAISAEHMLGMRLAEIDPQSLENHLAAETSPLKRDKLLQGYARTTGIHDPSRGLELDIHIQDPKARADNIRLHTEHWLESDRAAALAWLQSDSAREFMDHEQRARLLRIYHLEAAP